MTTEEIYNSIINEKESGRYPELDEMNTDSKLSFYGRIFFLIAFASKLIYDAFASLSSYLQDLFSKQQIGTVPWWIEQITNFQYGDQLVFKEGVFKYSVIDASKQIVKRVALETLNYVILFKVATEDEEGNLIRLDENQKSALTTYINKKKLPGTYISVFSGNADNMKFDLRIYYNSEFSKDLLTAEIENSIDNYLKTIVYNGEFITTKLIDELQSIAGILNPVVKGITAKPHTAPEEQYALVSDYYNSVAGYIERTGLTLEFIAHV